MTRRVPAVVIRDLLSSLKSIRDFTATSNPATLDKARADLDLVNMIDASGQWVGAVVPHPRIEGYWMAMWKPADFRDSGMKRYKSWRGAVARVQRIYPGCVFRAPPPT